METIRFRSGPLPEDLAGELSRRLDAAHRAEPLSAVDPRATVRRVTAIAAELEVRSIVYRGGLDLGGSEVDHVWVDLHGRVVDASFPLFVDAFVDVLRRFVAGDAPAEELAAAAEGASVKERVLGRFPSSAGYLGQPVWKQRR